MTPSTFTKVHFGAYSLTMTCIPEVLYFVEPQMQMVEHAGGLTEAEGVQIDEPNHKTSGHPQLMKL